MTQHDFETYITALPNVQRTEAFGYAFFFVGDDHKRPFVTIANSDSEYDNASNLSREGVFRLNIGLGKATFDALVGQQEIAATDYTALNAFAPHPDYSPQHFVCILNPRGANEEHTKQLILEAHAVATERLARRRTR